MVDGATDEMADCTKQFAEVAYFVDKSRHCREELLDFHGVGDTGIILRWAEEAKSLADGAPQDLLLSMFQKS